MTKRKNLSVLLAIALIAALMLSACGGGGGSSSEAPANDNPGTESDAPAPNPGADEGGEDAGAGLDIPTQQLTIGTASAGGAFYPIGTGVAEVISQHVEPLYVTAEITGGSVENPRLVATGESDMGLVNADHAAHANEGAVEYDQVYDTSAICSLHASVLHIVTLEKTGISSIADLRGKSVAVGPAGGGSIPAFTALLAEYDMTLDDIRPSYVSYDDGMSQLKDGQVDVALAMAGFPAASVLSLGATDKVVMISVPDDVLSKIMSENAFYSRIVVEQDVYDTDGDAICIGVRNLVIASNDLDEDTVYAMTKALYENLDELKTYHNALEEIELETMPNTSGVKLHPGAERYYTEIGVM